MKIDLRLLTICSCLTLIAAFLVTLVRFVEQKLPQRKIERALPNSGAIIGHLPAGLTLQTNARGLLLALPTCDIKGYKDKFLLHVYTETTRKTKPKGFVNMDFELQHEKGKETLSDGTKKCVFEKSFGGLAVEAVTVGQFKTPDGSCCEITWSRNFIFDATRKKK